MKDSDFDKNVFINCPYTPDYREFLQAIVFVLLRIGLEPKTASQDSDSGALRIAKIKELIESCRHGVHDLSLVSAVAAGEPARMNRPYELGIDLGARWFGKPPLDKKVTLVLEKKRGSVKSALSDLGGSDLRTYSGSIDKLINQLRQHFYAFLSKEQSGVPADYPTHADLWNDWISFIPWLQRKPNGKARPQKEIEAMEISEFTDKAREWIKARRPS